MLNFFEGHRVYMDGEYPAVFLDGKNTHVHRLEWIKHFGAIPDGFVIHHKNEDETDWNISNLELLSRKDHLATHWHEQYRQRLRGDKAPHRKLSQTDVDYIRSMYVKYDKNFGGKALAKKFGVTDACVSAIIRGENWGDG